MMMTPVPTPKPFALLHAQPWAKGFAFPLSFHPVKPTKPSLRSHFTDADAKAESQSPCLTQLLSGRVHSDLFDSRGLTFPC